MATRGIGAGVHTAALNQIQGASSSATVKLDAAQVKELSAGLTQMAGDMVSKFLKLRAAGDDAGASKVLSEQTVGATIDKFVIDAESGNIDLPAGTSATDVVSGAVSKFLEAGFTYSIDFQPQFGSHTVTASLDNGNVEWDDHRGR